MHEEHLKTLLERFRQGRLSQEELLSRLRGWPLETLATACLDHHRQVRTGLPEAVYGEGKNVEQLVEILEAMLARENVVLATRISPAKAMAVCNQLPGLTYHDTPRLLTGNLQWKAGDQGRGTVCIVSAGTSDLPVAEEARITLELFGHQVEPVYDAGVAGLHRILSHTRKLQSASVIIVVAGMEGALPSVVAGMTDAPVVAVPTSVGYGAGAGGISALLGMLNSCAPGLAVVNIDNGFGAACMAAAINRK